MKKDPTNPRGWQVAQDRQKKAYAKRMALRRYWKTRWEKEADFMTGNLKAMIARRREQADARTTLFREKLIPALPDSIPSADIRKHLSKALQALGQQGDAKQVHRVLMALRRRGLVRFDLATLTWMVAK